MTMTSADRGSAAKRAAPRGFSAEYKLRILEEYDSHEEPGDRGALLRRESLYSTHISAWRRARDQGRLVPGGAALSAAAAAELVTENAQLRARLERAETELESTKAVVDIMGKASALLQTISTEQERGSSPNRSSTKP